MELGDWENGRFHRIDGVIEFPFPSAVQELVVNSIIWSTPVTQNVCPVTNFEYSPSSASGP